jgi:hypothetical protein
MGGARLLNQVPRPSVAGPRCSIHPAGAGGNLGQEVPDGASQIHSPLYPQSHGTYTEARMRLFLCCLALVLLPQCGGGAAVGVGAKSSTDDAEGATSARDGKGHRGKSQSKREDEDEDDATSSSAPSSEDSKGPSCDDGTCSKCGGGICLAGWYCDERAGGGGACSWLPQCADKPTCGCVTRVLGSSCKCREESGALKVACD